MWFFHFALACKLQKKIDGELYAIIDVEDKAKKFFMEQKFVSFKKTWFFLDHIEPDEKTYDEPYLKEFEKKYKVNLWQIIYGDKYFYQQYNQFHKFKHNETMSLIYQECKLFEKILEETKPDFLITMNPINHYNILLHRMCLNSGITPITLSPGKLGKKSIISQMPFIFDSTEIKPQKSIPENDVEKYFEKYNPFKELMKNKKDNFEEYKFKRYSSILKFLASPRTKAHKKRYSNLGKTKTVVISNKFNNFIQKRRRWNFIEKNSVKDIETETPFVYFPLHYEPERTLLVDSPYYSDQIALIANIAKSLPVKYELFVKDHPMMQTIGWREPAFYQKIIDLPNVQLIHPNVKNSEIMKRCSLVMTIAGTPSIEAAFYKKPAIVFTNQFYSMLDSVTTIKKIEDLPNAIKTALNTKVELSSLRNFINLYENNSLEFPLTVLAAEFAYKFGFKGAVMDAILEPNEVDAFLKKHNDAFENLAEAHLTKIRSFQK